MKKVLIGLLIGILITKALSISTIYVGYTIASFVFMVGAFFVGAAIMFKAFKEDR